MIKIKLIPVIFLSCLLFGVPVFAQELVPQQVEEVFCPEIDFTILGQDEVKSNAVYEYYINKVDYTQFGSGLNIKHELWKGGDQIKVFEEESFSHEFSLSGSYLLKSSIEINENCSYASDKSISAFDEIIMYLGKGSEVIELNNANGGTGDYNLLIKEVITDETNSPDQLLATLSEYASHLRNADRIIIDTSSQGLLFETLGKLFSLNEINPTSIDTYVISDSNQSYFRRLLARYITAAGLEKVYVTQEQYFGSLFTSLLLKEDPKQYDFIKSYSVDLESSNKIAFLSYMTDYILINGFPLGLLTLMLLLPFVGLLISIARQIIGLSVFGVFTPLLFAVSMYVIGTPASLLLLLAAAIAVMLTNAISKRIYLLYSPKISLMLIFYCILALSMWRAHSYFGLNRINVSSYDNSFAIFPFIAILMVAKGVFSDSFLEFKKGRWSSLLEFFLISWIVLYILNSTFLQNIFLGNPELILFVLILNILVGRFTGLQLFEYFRFFPLIKNYFEEE